MEGGATQGAVWSNWVEEDVNILTVHKESYRFYAKSPLAKVVLESELGVKESNGM